MDATTGTISVVMGDRATKLGARRRMVSRSFHRRASRSSARSTWGRSFFKRPNETNSAADVIEYEQAFVVVQSRVVVCKAGFVAHTVERLECADARLEDPLCHLGLNESGRPRSADNGRSRLR